MTDRTADLAIDMAAEVVRLRHLIERILAVSDFTAAQQIVFRREAGITDDRWERAGVVDVASD